VERGAENLIPRPRHLHLANTAKEIDPTTKNLIYTTGGRIACPSPPIQGQQGHWRCRGTASLPGGSTWISHRSYGSERKKRL